MSSSIADTIIAKFTLSKSERKHLLLSAVAAGFSSILFAPLAGAAFAMEISTQGKWEWKSAPYFILSSFIALAVTNLLFTHQSALSILAHTQAFTLTFPQTTFDILAAILIGFFCAMFERIFVFLVKTMKNIFSKLSFHPYSGALIGSIVLLTIYRLAPYTQKFSGLGLTTIFYAFIEKSSWFDSIGKLIFTSFSIATGFQGGEIVPLLFMGSTLCSFLLSISPVPLSASLIAAAFPAVLSAACNTPMACSLLACELFGWNILPYSLLTCFTAYFFASKTGIYRTQLKLSKRWPYCPWKN